MNPPEPDIDSLIDALRSDLPQGERAARLRARLAAAGIVAGGVVAAPGTAAGTSAAAAGAKASVVSKSLFTLGGSKLGVAAAVVTAAVSVPVASYVVLDAREPSHSIPAPATGAPAAQRDQASEAARPNEPVVPQAAPVEPVTAAEPRARVNATSASPRTAPVAATPSRDERSAPAAAPSVAAFPAIGERSSQSTLREETELMDRALSALRAGETTRARELLGAHATRFPNGALVRERERALVRSKDLENSR